MKPPKFAGASTSACAAWPGQRQGLRGGSAHRQRRRAAARTARHDSYPTPHLSEDL